MKKTDWFGVLTALFFCLMAAVGLVVGIYLLKNLRLLEAPPVLFVACYLALGLSIILIIQVGAVVIQGFGQGFRVQEKRSFASK